MNPLYKYILVIFCLTSTLACSKLTYEEVAGTYVYKGKYGYKRIVLNADTNYTFYAQINNTLDTMSGEYVFGKKYISLIYDCKDEYNPTPTGSVVEDYSDQLSGFRFITKDTNGRRVEFATIIYYHSNTQDTLVTNLDGVAYVIDSTIKIDSLKIQSLGFESLSYKIKSIESNYFDIRLQETLLIPNISCFISAKRKGKYIYLGDKTKLRKVKDKN